MTTTSQSRCSRERAGSHTPRHSVRWIALSTVAVSDRHDDGHINSRAATTTAYTSALVGLGLRAGRWLDCQCLLQRQRPHRRARAGGGTSAFPRVEPEGTAQRTNRRLADDRGDRHSPSHSAGGVRSISVTSSRSLAHRCSPTPPVPRQTGSAECLVAAEDAHIDAVRDPARLRCTHRL